MLTPEELEIRKGFVGASDAPSIIGVNPYASAWDVYAEKTGIPIDRSEMAERFWWGSMLEETVAQRYMIKTGKTVRPMSPRIHSTEGWLRASADRIAVGEPLGLEIKTVSTFEEHMWGAEGTDQIPPHVRIQCEIGMACYDLPAWNVEALFGSFCSKTYHIPRPDPAYEQALIQALKQFWFEHVVARNPPEMDGSDGARQWLRAMYPRDTSEVRPADRVEDFEAIEAFIAAKQQEKEAKNTLAAARNKVVLAIGDAGGLFFSGGRLTYRANKNGVRSLRTKIAGIED